MKILLLFSFLLFLQPKPKPKVYSATVEYWDMGHKEARIFQAIFKDTTYFITDTISYAPFPYHVMWFKLDGMPAKKLHQ